jgi:hypothetical protein
MICGDKPDQSNNFVRYVARELKRNAANAPVNIVVCDDYNGELADLEDVADSYTTSAFDMQTVLWNWNKILKERWEKLTRGEALDLTREPLLLLIVQGNDFHETVCGSSQFSEILINMFTKYKRYKVCLLFAKVENVDVYDGDYADTLQRVVRENKLLCFEDLLRWKLYGVDGKVVRKFNKPLGDYEAYLKTMDNIRKIKTIACQDADASDVRTDHPE